MITNIGFLFDCQWIEWDDVFIISPKNPRTNIFTDVMMVAVCHNIIPIS